MMKSTMAAVIMGIFASTVLPVQPSPLAMQLAKHSGGNGGTARRKYRKPNKWDVMRTVGTSAVCRNRTTGEVATKTVKLGPCAQRKFDHRMETANV